MGYSELIDSSGDGLEFFQQFRAAMEFFKL